MFLFCISAYTPSTTPMTTTDEPGKSCNHQSTERLYLHLFILIFVHTCCLNQLISLYLLYFAESEFCGVYHASTGTLDSPNYPNDYPNNYHCLWLITLPSEDERVGIHIVDFNIESHSTCKWDALEVREVNNIFLKRTAHW